MATSVTFTYVPGVDTLYQNTAIAASLLTNQAYIGQSGTDLVSPANLTMFDARQYKELHFYMRADALTGGTTPVLQLNILCWDDGPTVALHPGAFKQIFTITSRQIPAAGGTVSVFCGLPGTTATSAASTTNVIDSPYTESYRPLFFQMQLSTSGSGVAPTGITNGRLSVYGVR